MFTERLLYARYCAKNISYINSFSLYNNPMMQIAKYLLNTNCVHYSRLLGYFSEQNKEACILSEETMNNKHDT